MPVAAGPSSMTVPKVAEGAQRLLVEGELDRIDGVELRQGEDDPARPGGGVCRSSHAAWLPRGWRLQSVLEGDPRFAIRIRGGLIAIATGGLIAIGQVQPAGTEFDPDDVRLVPRPVRPRRTSIRSGSAETNPAARARSSGSGQPAPTTPPRPPGARPDRPRTVADPGAEHRTEACRAPTTPGRSSRQPARRTGPRAVGPPAPGRARSRCRSPAWPGCRISARSVASRAGSSGPHRQASVRLVMATASSPFRSGHRPTGRESERSTGGPDVPVSRLHPRRP